MSETTRGSPSDNASRDATLQRWSDVFRVQTASIASIVPSMELRDEAQRAWGYEIEGLSRQLALAKAKWNAHALPCLLPMEILGYIFELWQEIDPVQLPNWWNKFKKHPGWVSATGICQHFRAVALGHAALWVSLSSESQWDLFLVRSRSALLYVTTREVKEAKYLPSVLANIERIRALSLINASPYAVAEVLKRNAPNLRRLSIDTSSKTHEPLDVGFLTLRSSRLHTLSLNGIGMPWQYICSPLALRSLDLSECDVSSGCSLADIVSCLRNMPLLEMFSSHLSLPRDDHPSSLTVSLPYLKHLYLDQGDASPPHLWFSLITPAIRYIEITVQTMELGDKAYNQLVAAIRQHLGQPWCPSYTTFHLGHYQFEEGSNVFSLFIQSSRVSNPEPNFDNSDHQLMFTSYPDGPNLELPVVSLFPSQNVHDFVLRQYIIMDASAMAQMFRTFRALETIKAAGSATAGKLVLSLLVSLPALEQSSAQPPYLPALRELSFEDVDFDSEVPDSAVIPGVLPGTRLYDLLLQTLRRRVDEGIAPIQLLSMRSCFTRDIAWMRSCEQHVSTVRWESAVDEDDVLTWSDYEQ